MRAGRDLLASLVVSLAALSFYISAASLLFQGPLAAAVPAAIGAALLGAAILGVASAWRGSLPLASVGAEPAVVPVLAAITAGVAAITQGANTLPTALVALAVTALATGGAWWWMGRRHAGDLIRYIPYPVIGGFIGAVGWLMFTGGIGVATGHPFQLNNAAVWLQREADARLATGLALGGVLWWASRRYRHVLTLPALLLGGALLIHAGLFIAGLDVAAARERGWLPAPFSHTWPVWPGLPAVLGAVQWSAVAQQAGLMASAVIVATLSLLLSITSLEVAWDTRADLNRDLRALGAGNLLAGLSGGLVGGVSMTRSVLNGSAGANSRLSGCLLAGVCLLAMAWGGPLISLVPRPLLGGLLVYLGLGMLKTWLVDSRRQLPWRDHLTVLLMVGITAVAGFLSAVFVGILACCLDLALSSARLSPVRRVVPGNAWPGKVERPAAQAELLQVQHTRLRIIELQGLLFFGSTTQLRQRVEGLLAEPLPPKRLLIDFQHVNWVDSSAAQALLGLFRTAQRHGTVIELSHVGEALAHSLKAVGQLGANTPRMHPDIDAAMSVLDDEVLATQVAPTPQFGAWLSTAMPSPAARLQVMAYFDPVQLPAGATLFSQGEPSEALYLVQSGRLSAHVRAGEREVWVRSIHAGGAIGEMGLFRSSARSATVRADEASVVLQLRRERLEAMQREVPELAASLYRQFLNQMAARVDQLTAQANALSR